MIVDDDPEYGKFLEELARILGFSPLRAFSLAAARELIARHTPELFLLDESLEDGSGLDFCRELRGEPRLAKTLVAMITGRRRAFRREAWYDAGVDQCLSKTSRASKLRAALQALIRRRQWDMMLAKPSVPGSLIDYRGKQVIYGDQSSARLTDRQMMFMDLLLNAYPDPLARETIQEKVACYGGAEQHDLALNEFIHKLRMKLPPAMELETVCRVGYRLKIVKENSFRPK